MRSFVEAAYPCLAVETVEEERLTAHLKSEFLERQVLSIAALGGLRDLKTGLSVDAECPYTAAFTRVASQLNTVLVVFDWHHVARNAVAYRALKDCFANLKANGSCVVLVAPTWKLPAELEHDIPVIEWALPSRDQLQAALTVVAQSVDEHVTPEREAACLDAAAGLTLQQAENAFALALVERNELDPQRIAEEKMRLVKNSGYLEVWRQVSPSAVGGLDGLKEYVRHEVLPCRDEEDLRVRGVLLVGIPGTGKSLAAKAAGAMLGYPVLRMDIGALKGSLVGQSESNMRAALKLAEAVAPCVLWLDEIEKSVGGYQSSAATDSGVTLGMVGTLLTWMQEHRAPILTVATCNDYAKLPAELTRAGRFDERFFVDLPTSEERSLIAAIHLGRYCFALPDDAVATAAVDIARITDGWTGAEIEQLVKSAARRSNRQPDTLVFETCALDIKPLSKVREAETNELRAWAASSLRLANASAGIEDAAQFHGAPSAATRRPASPSNSSGRTHRVSRDGDAFLTGISLN